MTEPRDVDFSYPAGHFTALARADDLHVVSPSAQLLDQELSLVLGSSASARGVVEGAVEHSQPGPIRLANCRVPAPDSISREALLRHCASRIRWFVASTSSSRVGSYPAPRAAVTIA